MRRMINSLRNSKGVDEEFTTAELWLRDIALSSTDWIWEIDADDNFTYVSDRVEDVLGYQPEELIGRSAFDLILPEKVEDVRQHFGPVAERMEPLVDMINWNVHKSGRLVCMLSNGVPVVDDQGNLLGYRGVDRDVTQRVLANQQNHQLIFDLKQFHSIVNNSFAVAYRRKIDSDNVDYISDNVIQFGFTAEQLKAGDVRWSELFHPDDRDCVVDEMDACFRENREVVQQEYRLVDRDQHERWVEDFCTIVRNQEGEVTHVQGVLLEISNRKRLENEVTVNQERLELQKRELETKNIALRELIHQVETEKDRALSDLMTNVDSTLLPMVRRLKKSNSKEAVLCGELLEKSINSLTTPSARSLANPTFNLTSRELEICHLIQNGFGTKEIAQQLSISIPTVSSHRRHIRKKLKLVDSHKNLSTALKSL
jgi:PAS domain S-box-containing protein